MKSAFVCQGRFYSSHGPIGMEAIRQLAALKDVTHVVAATITKLEHGEEVDISAVLRRSAGARDGANRIIDAMISRKGRAMETPR